MAIWSASPRGARMLSVFRAVVGLLFLSYGTSKLFGFPPMPAGGPAHLPTMLRAAGTIETIGGTLIILGLGTRPVAFILSGEMAVAYFTAHFPKSVFPTVNGGMPAVLFCFIYLYVCVAGGGAWSVDALITAVRSKGTADASRPAHGALSEVAN